MSQKWQIKLTKYTKQGRQTAALFLSIRQGLLTRICYFLSESVVPLIVADNVKLVLVNDFARLAFAVKDVIDRILLVIDSQGMDEDVRTILTLYLHRIHIDALRGARRIVDRSLTFRIRI